MVIRDGSKTKDLLEKELPYYVLSKKRQYFSNFMQFGRTFRCITYPNATINLNGKKRVVILIRFEEKRKL